MNKDITTIVSELEDIVILSSTKEEALFKGIELIYSNKGDNFLALWYRLKCLLSRYEDIKKEN